MMNYVRRSLATCIKKYKSGVTNYCPGCDHIFYFHNRYSTSPESIYDIDLKINNVSLNNYLRKLEEEYDCISKDQNYLSNSRLKELHSVVQLLKERRELLDNINNLKELLQENDAEMRKLAEDEQHQLQDKIKLMDDQLVEVLLPVNEDATCNAIVLEVQAGVGGQEAMLFAKEMFNMYCNFIEYKGWELEVADYLETDIGGIRQAVALITGPFVFQYFKHEVGIHRVQRTPATEKSGRIHTSTISVIALPQPTDIQISINPKDLKIETKRSTGAGGQHVNTTDSAVRITHLPTGVTVECQVDRSQIKNRKMAMARLNTILYQRELDSQIAETQATRKNQVRTKNRNEKIRTYNFNQNRITDHRLTGSHIHNLEMFFEGGEYLEELILKLEKQERIDNLLSIVNNNVNK